MTKLAIVINWIDLRNKMKEYLDARNKDDEHELRAIALSDFLIWLRRQQQQKRQETTNGTKPTN
jgi:hypothetical protein